MPESYIKRFFDIVASLLGLILLSPLFLIAAILIKVTSPGPVFFVQERVGKNGKIFKIWKFRTMFLAKQEFSVEQTREFEKNSRDPRITPFGYFLRESGIDELPQLINILSGDMSFVGPRPFYPPRYDLNQNMRFRLEAKPGLTGLNIIKGGAKLSEEETMALDLEYIKKQNFWLDLKIIFKTIFLYISKLWKKKDSKIGKNL
jgi:lipopolysaccharide/colanic/teichoic acid biosynthesis glycosyltransferase